MGHRWIHRPPAAVTECIEACWPKAAPGRVRRSGSLPAPLDHIGWKAFRPKGGLAALGDRIRVPPAEREWRVASQLGQRGIAVPVPLALAIDDDGSAIYFFEWYPERIDLEAGVLQNRLSLQQRRKLAARLGDLIRKFHDAGFEHRDLHAGNILIHPEAGDAEPLLTDFHRARPRGQVSPRRRARDLLQLSHFFQRRATATEALRFLKHYGKPFWHSARSARRRAVLDLAHRAHRSWYAFLRHHEKRCLGSGRRFRPWQEPGWQGVMTASESVDAGKQWLDWVDHPDRAVEIHRGGHGRVLRIDLRGTSWVLKCYEDPGGKGLGKAWARGSRARRAWLNAHRLAMADISVARPLLFGEEPWRSKRRRSFVVMPFEGRGQPLRDHVLGATSSRAVDRVLARQIAAAHDECLRNRDLKAENLLVDPIGPRVIWLDPDGVRRTPRVDEQTIARDLMRLNASFRAQEVTATRRLRFLLEYRRARRNGRPSLKTLWREIHWLTLQKWQRTT